MKAVLIQPLQGPVLPETHDVSKKDLKLLIFLPLRPTGWDPRYAPPPHLVLGIKPRVLCMPDEHSTN